MKKKLLSLAVAVAMLGAFAVPAYAGTSDSVAPTGPSTGNISDNTSNGEATITSTDGTNFYTENDDDGIPVATDTNGADISVWATVGDATPLTYKINITWGMMLFTYSASRGTWNTTTHAYEGTASTGWAAASVDGTNNKITITSDSNHAVEVTPTCTDGVGTPLNTNTSAAYAVRGHFFDENSKAESAAQNLTDSANVPNALTGTVKMHTADAYYGSQDAKNTSVFTEAAGARTANLYFALSGKPDTMTLDTPCVVGTIKITVAPLTSLTGFEF